MIAPNQQHRILWLPNEERMFDDDTPSRSSAGVRINSSNAHTVSAVFSCVRIIAETVASLPLHVLERTAGGGKRLAKELPLYRQLHSQPNSWQTSFEWREQAVMHVALWGDAFDELVPGQIVPLHPSRMKTERIENGKLRYKYREEKGTETVYDEAKILQIRGPSDDGVNGLSIVEECKDAIALARACELHGARFFAAGARPGFVLSTEGQLNAEAREALRSQWDRRHGGVGNSHNTAVLTGGLKPYDIPQASNTDSQFIELRRYQLEEIARLFRCPGWLLGLGAGGPQAEIEFVTHTILPWLRRFESAFTRDLIGDDDRYLVEFDVRGLLRGDAASRASYFRAMWDIGVVSTNDIRADENMDPVEGGDVRYRPLNMGTLGENPSESDVKAQQQPGSGIDGQAVEGGLAAAGAAPPQPEAEPAQSEEPQVADVSLNGAQINGLIAILAQVPAGLLTKDGAAAMVAASFPSISPDKVSAILAGVVAGNPAGSVQPPQAAPAPAAPQGRSLSESRAMTVSIDFDRTFSADPQMWGEFAKQATADGNTVVMISRRPDTPEDRQTVTETLGEYSAAFSQVLLIGDTLKDEAAKAAGIDVDVWVDDSPQFIRSEDRNCGANADGGGGFQPGNKCGKGEGGGGGKKSGGRVKADGPAHAKGSKLHKAREQHRQNRKVSDYPPARPGERDSSVAHTTTPRFDANGKYIAPESPNDWTPERQSMHREVIADATAGVPRSEKPTLYMMGGGPASGKSSIIDSGQVKHPEKHVRADPDEYKKDIPEYRSGIAADDSSSAYNAHEESSYLNKQVMAAARSGGNDVVWDGTGDNSIEKLESQVMPFRKAGYKVQADYVTVDTEGAIARAQKRAADPKSDSYGRVVPEEHIRQIHSNVSQIWPEAVRRGLFDQSDLYDTNTEGKAIKIASAAGTKLTIHDKAAYDKFLAKAKPRN